jgi:hypothetical protein
MKKLALTFAIVLGMTIGAFAQGGLFGMGSTRGGDNENRDGSAPMISLPTEHGKTDDQGAPLGSGIAVLVGLGAAYAMTKRNKK